MLETWGLLLNGIAAASSPTILIAVAFGAVVGLFIGALPGLGPTAGVAILLPLVIGFDGTAAVAALGGVYYGSQYGGGVTAILLGIPGDSAATMTVIDGYALAKRGEAGAALGISIAASFIGGLVGLILLTTFATTIASAAIAFGPVEMTAVMVFALSLVSVLGGKDPIKGLLGLCLGLWLGTVGLDPIVGIPRFDLGSAHLFDGIEFSILAVGLFGLAEMYNTHLGEAEGENQIRFRMRDLLPQPRKIIRCWRELGTGSVIGFIVGVLPGAGATAATMITYAVAKRMAKDPERFGNGAYEGVAAPEAANNAASYGSMIPMFALGIPGSGTTAVLLGGLLMIGLQPGPMLFQTQPDFVWTIFGSFYIGNLALVAITILLTPLLASCAFVKPGYLFPAVIAIVAFGIYSINYSMFDVMLAMAFGVIGYVMMKLGYPPVPLILGLILGPILERGIRRTLVGTNGDPSVFFQSPIAVVLFLASAVMLFWPLIRKQIRNQRARPATN
ncbi:tripartite tricarboxylate transporter permease [Paracoccus aestuariivivens]|uniref:TctA subunit of the tripartite Tricarboxylate transport(TTT) family protein n=1 Tax=Paracoccus aestuariivivens TaxID=1820333 RepID=A0A6L6JBE1_9RHOB|nr:tripartite tricarboxylate transporter permease [Paracoccus aestuariivivens]MTH78535.1 TctA subunit of the tripartite Tricarboxylate transport(TTT) family protein [Paracoccus aestuariivivens]